MKPDKKALGILKEAIAQAYSEYSPEDIKRMQIGAEQSVMAYLDALDLPEASLQDTVQRSQNALRVILKTTLDGQQALAGLAKQENLELANAFLYYLKVIGNQAEAYLSGSIN